MVTKPSSSVWFDTRWTKNGVRIYSLSACRLIGCVRASEIVCVCLPVCRKINKYMYGDEWLLMCQRTDSLNYKIAEINVLTSLSSVSSVFSFVFCFLSSLPFVHGCLSLFNGISYVCARTQHLPIYFCVSFFSSSFFCGINKKRRQQQHLTQVGIISESATAANPGMRRWWYGWMGPISFRSNAFWNTAGCRCAAIGYGQRFGTRTGMGRCKLIQFIICLSQMSSVKCHKFIRLNSLNVSSTSYAHRRRCCSFTHTHTQGYTDEPISTILKNIGDSDTVLLDRWSLKVTPNPNAKDEKRDGKDNLPLNVVNNYFSFGVDAHIALEFHEAREAHPERFNSRLRNKMFYGQAGGKDLLKRKWKDLSEMVTLECDGKDITPKLKEHRVHAIVLLNIPSYGGGTRPWASSGGKQATDDGLIEVVGLTTYQLPLLQAGKHGTCIAQCKTAKIVTTKTIPMQVDGEAAKLKPSIIELSLLNKACMLAKRKPGRVNVMWV